MRPSGKPLGGGGRSTDGDRIRGMGILRPRGRADADLPREERHMTTEAKPDHPTLLVVSDFI